MMKSPTPPARPRPLAAQTAFTWLVLAVFALLLFWPIVSIPGNRGSSTMFYYVFAVWAAMIALLGVIAFALRRAANAAEADDGAAPREDS